MHISEKCCYFALAFEEETNRKAGKKVLRKVFWKKSTKNLVVSKKCLIFAPLSRQQNRETVKKVLEKIFEKKFTKNLVVSKKQLTFAPLSRQQNCRRKMRKKFWQYRGRKLESIEVLWGYWAAKFLSSLARENFKAIPLRLELRFIQNYFLQWRVWSWLRMNASGRLNTCKSRGSIKRCLQRLVATGARVRNAYATYL